MCKHFSDDLEDRDKRGTTRHKHEGDGEFEEVFFGRLVRLVALRHALSSEAKLSRFFRR